MEKPWNTNDITAQEYTTGVRKLFSIGAENVDERIVRGIEPAGPAMLDAEQIAFQASQLELLSRSLTQATASDLDDPDPRIRADASTRLLAKAMVDLQVSAFLLDAAQQEASGSTGKRGVERGGFSRGAGMPSGLDEYLNILNGQAAPPRVQVERGITQPPDLPRARVQLSLMINDVLDQVETRAGKAASSSLSSLLTMGVGQVFNAAGVVGLNIASAFGIGDKLSQLFQLFRQFYENAYNALVALLGEELTKAAASQVAAWVNSMVQGEKFVALLEKLYQTAKTREELCQLVETSPAELEKYIGALTSLDTLNTQYLKQISIIDKMMLVLRFVSGVPAAALPQGQLILAATYIVLCGYVIYAGADYVDAPGMTRLDRIPGPRRIITGSLTATPPTGSKPQTTPPPPPPTAPPTTREIRSSTPPSAHEGIPKDLSGGVSFGLGPNTRAEPEESAAEEEPAGLVAEKIRMDVAVPNTPVMVGETFEVAVAIRQPSSAKLSLDGLGTVESGDGMVYRRDARDLVRYRVVISAPGCDIVSAEYLFVLQKGKDSPPYYFQLTPKRPGSLSIIVTAFQETDLVAQTRVRVVSSVEAQAADQLSTQEKRNILNKQLKDQPKQPARIAGVKDYIDLDVELFDYEIDNQQVERYKVRLVSALCGEQKLSDADLVEIPAKVRNQLSLLKFRRLDSGQIVELGKQLGQMLFPPKARRYYQRALAKLDSDEYSLRIRIKVDNIPLANIAWEYVYLTPDDAPADYHAPDGFLVLNRNLSLVRYEIMDHPVTDLDPIGDQSLRVVMLLASGSALGLPELDLTQEQANISKALANMSGIDLECFPDASTQTLQDALENPAFIFHFAGHGTFRGELGPIRGTLEGEGYLALDGSTEEECLLPATTLALILKGCGVRLAVLGVCEGGERDPVNAWTGIAPALARADVPAVVAMQFNVYDKSALNFHRALYRALAQGYPIDKAVSNGRIAIFSTAGTDRDWGVPVLYLRCDDGVLFPKE